MLPKSIKYILALLLINVVSVAILALYGFQIKTEGTLELDNSYGTVSITREVESGVIHIRGANELSTYYAQGFVHA